MKGLLKYRDGMWGVGHLKPHVAMRFKDVFKGIPFGSTPLCLTSAPMAQI